MPPKNPGPKPRRFKSRSYSPKNGYWYAWIAGTSRPFARWTTTDLVELDRLFAEKKEHCETLNERAATDNATVTLSNLERKHLSVNDLVNLYLASRARHVNHMDPGRRISPVTFSNYERTLRWVSGMIGGLPVADLKPDTFTQLLHRASDQYGPKQCNTIVITTRMVFHWAVQNGHLDKTPLYGSEFVSTNEALRMEGVRQKPLKLFTAAQIKSLLAASDQNTKAMIYLGINCAYVQSDCAELPITFGDHPTNRIHLEEDPYIRFDRPKTGERRKCTLWPETVDALKAVIGDRTEGSVFLTRKGFPLIHQAAVTNEEGAVVRYANCDSTTKKFRELCERTGVRPKDAKEDHPLFGVGFSSLRTTFETVAFNNPDLSVAHQAAIAWIMGHKLSGVNISKMADRYLQDVSNSTLALVTDQSRRWLLEQA